MFPWDIYLISLSYFLRRLLLVTHSLLHLNHFTAFVKVSIETCYQRHWQQKQTTRSALRRLCDKIRLTKVALFPIYSREGVTLIISRKETDAINNLVTSIFMLYRGNISSKFSSNSETAVSEEQECIEIVNYK